MAKERWRRPTDLDTVHARLNRSTESVTISYERDDGTVYTILGYGETFRARVADADAKLPTGEWRRVCVSTPSSIYADLHGRQSMTRTGMLRDLERPVPPREGKAS